jgi:hypothetical protein
VICAVSGVPLPRFTLEDQHQAHDEWGSNCGPAALALVAGKTLSEVRTYLGDFEKKRYTNPTLMFDSLRRLGVKFRCNLNQQSSENQGALAWPDFGLARVQWEGPWTAPGVPIRVRYRHTHWVAAKSFGSDCTVPGWQEPKIFDVNALCVGGWIPLSEWSESLVPWLLPECEPKANGKWHLTHSVEVIG